MVLIPRSSPAVSQACNLDSAGDPGTSAWMRKLDVEMDHPRSTAGFVNRVLPLGGFGRGQAKAALQFLECFQATLRVDGGRSGLGLRNRPPNRLFLGDTPRLREALHKVSRCAVEFQ